MNATLDERVNRLIFKYLWRTKAAAFVAEVQARGARPVLFAGAVRDALRSVDHQIPYVPRDFDIGVSGMTRPVFDGMLRRIGGQPNRYGGYLVEDGSRTRLDIWRIEETCGVKLLGVPITIENVLRTFVLDVNAVAFDLVDCSLYDLGSRIALRRASIDFVEGALLHSHSSFAARAAVLAQRFRFTVSPRIAEFMTTYYDHDLIIREYRKHLLQVPEVSSQDATPKDRPFYSAAA